MHSSLIVASLAILIDLVAADVPNPSTDRSQLLEFPVGLLGNSEFNSAPLEKLHRSSRLLGSSFGLPLDKEFDYVVRLSLPLIIRCFDQYFFQRSSVEAPPD